MTKTKLENIYSKIEINIAKECEDLEYELYSYSLNQSDGAKYYIYTTLLEKYSNFPLKHITLSYSDLLDYIQYNTLPHTIEKYVILSELFLNIEMFTLKHSDFFFDNSENLTTNHFDTIKHRILYILNLNGYTTEVTTYMNKRAIAIVENTPEINVLLSEDIPNNTELITEFKNYRTSINRKVDILTHLYNSINREKWKNKWKSVSIGLPDVFAQLSYLLNNMGVKHQDETKANLVKLIDKDPKIIDEILKLYAFLVVGPEVHETLNKLHISKKD